MKHMKTVEIPATRREVVDFVSCDFCSTKIELHRYNVDKIEVKHKTGSSYPEGGSGTETSVDMCGKCFDERLVQWLRSQGVEPRTEDWDW